MANTFKGIVKDLTGKRGAATLHGREGSGSEDSSPPVESDVKVATIVKEKEG